MVVLIPKPFVALLFDETPSLADRFLIRTYPSVATPMRYTSSPLTGDATGPGARGDTLCLSE